MDTSAASSPIRDPGFSEPRADSLRKWPAVVISVLVLAAVTIPAMVVPGTVIQFYGMMLGPMAGGGLFLLWWLLASRRPSWLQRLGGVLFVALAGAAAFFLGDESIRMVLMVRGTTSVILVTTVWFLISRQMPWRAQLWGAGIVVAGVLGLWCTIRMDGVDGAIVPTLSWRWAPTKEQQYVSSLQDLTPKPPAESTAAVVAAEGDWVGFRGPDRNGQVRGVQIDTDWSANPPSELWRRPIGPAWSSFAVVGDLLYTQEQRGDLEAVLCLSAKTGEEVWVHTDETRFWESMAGAGPRATPTFHDGRIYAVGANGLLNCLDAASGERLWKADLRSDGEARLPEWGFAGSPLIVGETVIAYAGGGQDRGLIAYDRSQGELRWKAGSGTHSYSSPQLVSFHDTPQVLMLTERGLFSVAPDSGQQLWNHDWIIEMNRSVQPNVYQTHVFLGTGFGKGTRSLAVTQDADGWEATENWTSNRLKPYFNDFVTHEDHLYGFDGNVFACVEIASGERRWKRGRYGNGQVLLLADQGLLLILSEKGEVVLVSATSEKHQELARFPAIQGKTWNHPVLAHGRLFVRNAEEAACFTVKPL